MHIAPPEASQTAPSVQPLQDHTSASQHGLYPVHDQVSDGRPLERPEGEPSSAIDPSDDASVASSATSRGRRSDSRRMNNARQDSNESSPGSRVDAYERANAIPRRPSDGMIFQLVPSGRDSSDVTVLDLPNGTKHPYDEDSSLTFLRGTNSHSLPPSSRVSLFDEFGQHPIPPTCHCPSSMENCLCSIFPWRRVHRLDPFRSV